MKLRFKLLASGTLPTRGKPGDAGLDLYARHDVYIAPMDRERVGTGVQVEIPPGCVGLILDRSSMAAKGLHILAGVIDSNFRGELRVLLQNLNGFTVVCARGERVAQLLVVRLVSAEPVEAEELSTTDRGEQGFGSTGK